MIKFMIGYRTSNKGKRFLGMWLENEEGKTIKYISFDKQTCLEIAILYNLNNKNLEDRYCIGDSTTNI